MYFWKKFFTVASGNQFFPFFRYSWQLKVFSYQSKFILITNCWNWFSGQSKLLYHNFSNIISTGSSFSISSKYVLNEYLTTVSCNGFLFKWNDILSFIFFFFFWNHYAIGGRWIFKKILFLLVETIFFNFLRHWFKWKQSFSSLRSYFSTNSSFWLVEKVSG